MVDVTAEVNRAFAVALDDLAAVVGAVAVALVGFFRWWQAGAVQLAVFAFQFAQTVAGVMDLAVFFAFFRGLVGELAAGVVLLAGVFPAGGTFTGPQGLFTGDGVLFVLPGFVAFFGLVVIGDLGQEAVELVLRSAALCISAFGIGFAGVVHLDMVVGLTGTGKPGFTGLPGGSVPVVFPAVSIIPSREGFG